MARLSPRIVSDSGRSRRGPAARAVGRTVRALVAARVLDRSRDAAAIERITALADAIDDVGDAGEFVQCPACEAPVRVGPNTVAMVRLSRELRAWWEAVRARKDAVTQGDTLADIFAALDGDLRGAGDREPRP